MINEELDIRRVVVDRRGRSPLCVCLVEGVLLEQILPRQIPLESRGLPSRPANFRADST